MLTYRKRLKDQKMKPPIYPNSSFFREHHLDPYNGNNFKLDAWRQLHRAS